MKKTILQIVVYCVCKAYICYEEKDSRCHSYDLPCQAHLVCSGVVGIRGLWGKKIYKSTPDLFIPRMHLFTQEDPCGKKAIPLYSNKNMNIHIIQK